MAYWYKGKRYERRGVKAKIGRFAHRVWQSMQGGYPQGGGGRPAEHYIDQAMREVQAALDKSGGETGEKRGDE
jgi:hypothetical protein